MNIEPYALSLFLVCSTPLLAQTNAPLPPPPPGPEELYEEVEAAVAQKQWEEALALTERILAAAPAFAPAHRAAAYVNYEIGRHAAAEEALTRFRTLAPRDHHNILVLLGRIQMARGRYREAARTFEEVVLLQPRAPGIYTSLGKLYYHLGEYALAAERLSTARTRDPPRFHDEATELLKSAYAQQIDELIAASRLEDAVDYLDRMLALDPPMAVAFLQRGAVLAGLGTDLSQAEADVITYITAHAGTARAHLLLGNIRQKKGEYGQAIRDYERALELDPDIPGVHALVGALYYRRRDFDGAIRNLSQALEQTPDNAVIRFNLGMACLRDDRLPAARDAMRKVAELHPESPRPYLILAQVALFEGKIPRALERLEQWAARVEQRTELDRLRRERIFERLYNNSQYHALLKDLESRLRDPLPAAP